ncbi:site-specific integrase [Burkholderia multivorans]|uniref:site-specific integrase n=1 Tax=Burkholderia multivorans TaxID=87883 RepID=UPI0021C09C8D|nr:site-specific integrase [Burkholderia multivorans]
MATTEGGEFAKRYPALARLPFIMDSRPGYHRLGNAYIAERGLGLWGPEIGSSGHQGAIPTAQTMRNYAEWLANFLEWAEVRSVSIFDCDYAGDVAGRYQREMLSGGWSQTGRGLSPTTVNLRVQQACDFLTWLVDRKKRGPFHIPYAERTYSLGSAFSPGGQYGRKIRVRKGKVRPRTVALCMPKDVEVHGWLERIRDKFGATCALMCETVLLTGLRREEVVCLRTDTLPENQAHWHVANPLAPPSQQQVRITVRFGTKGASYGTSHGDKIGPERSILIPLILAEKWHVYRNDSRHRAFAQWMTGAKGPARWTRAAQSVHLFLREADGARFSGTDFYAVWTGVTPPTSKWSPHQGRHWWACSTLWRALKKHEFFWREIERHKSTNLFSDETTAALIDSTALSIIRLQIQPQLGHASDSTTIVYLRWVIDMISVPLSIDIYANDAIDYLGDGSVSG